MATKELVCSDCHRQWLYTVRSKNGGGVKPKRCPACAQVAADQVHRERDYKRNLLLQQNTVKPVDIRILNSFTDLRRRVEVAKRLLQRGLSDEALAELDGHEEAGDHVASQRESKIGERYLSYADARRVRRRNSERFA